MIIGMGAFLLAIGAANAFHREPVGPRSRFDQSEPAAPSEEPAAKRAAVDGAAGAPAAAAAAKPNLEAIQKAKAALQKHKELAAKLKSMPQLAAMAAAKAAAAKTASGVAAPPALAKVAALVQGGASAAGTTARPMALRLDAQGREVDEHGNLVQAKTKAVATLKVNVMQQKVAEFASLAKADHKAVNMAEPKQDLHFDPSMKTGKGRRDRRATFQFVEPGKLEQAALKQRLKAQFGEKKGPTMLEEKQEMQRLARALAEPDTPVEKVEVKIERGPLPVVEWWDKPLLKTGKYEDVEDSNWNVKSEKINLYVEHPIPLYAPMQQLEPGPQPLRLTKAEQKKLRTQRRNQREKERQEMVKQGLLEPPPPKVKITNLMRVLGEQAVMDPTQIEAEVRRQMKERQEAHEDRNLASKLTTEERREKKLKKLFEDNNAPDTLVALYKIKDLSNKHNRYKVDINAQENRVTGVALACEEGYSIVLIEGVSKSLKRYSKLMLRRIDWNEGREEEEEEAAEQGREPREPNQCVLVWQGSVVEPSFQRWRFESCRTMEAAKKLLVDAGVGHYWDTVANAGWEGISELQ